MKLNTRFPKEHGYIRATHWISFPIYILSDANNLIIGQVLRFYNSCKLEHVFLIGSMVDFQYVFHHESWRPSVKILAESHVTAKLILSSYREHVILLRIDKCQNNEVLSGYRGSDSKVEWRIRVELLITQKSEILNILPVQLCFSPGGF